MEGAKRMAKWSKVEGLVMNCMYGVNKCIKRNAESCVNRNARVITLPALVAVRSTNGVWRIKLLYVRPG